MNPDKAKLKSLSFLLQYPDQTLVQELKNCRCEIEALFEGSEQEMVRELIRHLLQTPVLALQETFSAAFDLNPATCLNLTYHRYGDEKERGAALARYAQAYEDAGFSAVQPELPDYLPMLLELVAQDEEAALEWMLAENRHAITALAEGLAAGKNPYAGLFQVLSRMLPAAKTHADTEV